MFVYKAIMEKSAVDPNDTTIWLEDPWKYELGLYSNQKKAMNELIKNIDDVVDWPVNWGEYDVKVKIYKMTQSNIRCRIQTKDAIIWMEGVIEKVRVL